MEIDSPRLASLSSACLQREDSVEGFWEEVAVTGAPIIERADDDPDSYWVTFLWRDSGHTNSVSVFGGPTGWTYSGTRMMHLPGTDVWFKTCRVRGDARFTYWLAENRSDETWAAIMRQDPSHWILDPLNPNVYPEKHPFTTVVALPDAPAQPWIIPEARAKVGTISKDAMDSTVLNNRRNIWIYKPYGYDTSGDPYPLLVCLDGEEYTELIPTPTILDNLIRSGQIPPVAAVFVGNAEGARSKELTCSERFDRFLTTELLPRARQQLHVTNRTERTILAGSSYGGLAACYSALRHPDLFGNVLSQSGSFFWSPEDDPEPGLLMRQFARSNIRSVRFFLEVGLMEGIRPSRPNGPTQLSANRHMRDVLTAKGLHVAYAEYNGGHDFVSWRGSFADGLMHLTRSW